MRKILCTLLTIIAITACSKESFKGKEYKLNNAENNAEIMIGFDEEKDRFFGSVVNRYMGAYKIDGNKISFGNAASTMMMGPQDLMQTEANYLKELAQVKSFTLKGEALTLELEDGKKLSYTEIKK